MLYKILENIENDKRHLEDLAKYIDKNIYNDPVTVISKARTFAEIVTNMIIMQEENLEYAISLKQVERISELSNKEIIPREIVDYLHTVRKLGNIAVHDIVEGALGCALTVHKALYKIMCWYIEQYVKVSFKQEEYIEPTIESSNKEDTKIMERLKRLENKLNNNIIDVKETIDSCHIKKLIVKKEKISKSCLVEELKKLKESAKEAVEGLEEFSSFKKYMHVDRTMHKKLEDVILRSNNFDKQKLILVCGSAGDGKSHIISYLKDKHSDIIDNFKLWNDATESLDPKKTAMDTLNNVLEAFNDTNIGKNNKKMILAINLGTLNNFIDSKYGENYKLFRQFVYEKKILDTAIIDNEYNENSSFEFVNFGDYHIYELENGKEESVYISGLINKITKSSNKNIFYKSYCDNCLKCENKNTCPIKFNYELLGKEEVNKKVVQVLIEAIVKNKLIIPTRALLNFIFDIIVGKLGIKSENLIFKKNISNLSENAFIDSLLPNILFEQEDISYIFKAIKKLDPLNIKMNNLDDFIIEFNTAEKVDIYFKENLNIPDGYLEKIFETDLESKVNHKLRDKLLTLFVRQFRLAAKTEVFDLSDEVYKQYIRDIYYWNKGDKRELKNIYINVKNAILKWNGDSEEKEINIFIGKKQSKYKISEEIEIKPDTSNLSINTDSKLERFLEDLNLIYKVKDKSFNFDIDYSLYKTLSKINKGYRPNKIDKSHYIKFVECLNNIIECGSQDEFIFFTEKNKEKNKKYKLEYDEDFGFEFKEVK